MSNVLLTPEVIASQALASLNDLLVMRPLVYTDLSQEFTNAKIGDTVNVRKPAVFTANRFDRNKGVQLQAAKEESIPVKVDQISDVSFAITNEELTMSVEDFDAQFLSPAMEAIANDIDRAILDLRDDVKHTVGTEAGMEWNKPEVLIDADRVLSANRVPVTDRYAIVGTGTKAKWLNSPVLKEAHRAGDDTALNRARLKEELFGFTPYWTQCVNPIPASGNPAPGDPATEVGIAFHKSALGFVSVPMPVPPGAMGSTMNYNGLNVRVMYQNDIMRKQTVISVDTLFGVKCIDPNRAVLIKGGDVASTGDNS